MSRALRIYFVGVCVCVFLILYFFTSGEKEFHFFLYALTRRNVSNVVIPRSAIPTLIFFSVIGLRQPGVCSALVSEQLVAFSPQHDAGIRPINNLQS